MAARLVSGKRATGRDTKHRDGHTHQNGVVNGSIRSNGVAGHFTVDHAASKVTQPVHVKVETHFVGQNGSANQCTGPRKGTEDLLYNKSSSFRQNGSVHYDPHKQNGTILNTDITDITIANKTVSSIDKTSGSGPTKILKDSPSNTPKLRHGRPGVTVKFAQEIECERKSPDTSVPGPARTNTFRNAVHRHFGKDRLFRLVQTLLSTVSEERKAQEDLIASFETARNIKVPGFEHPAPPPTRVKRRRRKSEVSLADRIELNRRLKRSNSGNDTSEPTGQGQASKTVIKEGEERSDDSNKDNDDLNTEGNICDNGSDNQQEFIEERPCSVVLVKEKAIRNNEGRVKFDNTVVKEVFDETSDSKLKNIRDEQSVEHNSENVSEQDSEHNSENTSENEETSEDEIPLEKAKVDQLVLESVLSNSFSCDEGNEHTLVEPVIIVEVEADSESEFSDKDSSVSEYCLPKQPDIYSNYRGECIIVLSGEKDEMASSDEDELCKRVEIEDLGDDGSDSDIKTLNERMANLSPVEYERKPKMKRKTKPKLDPITEAVNSRGSLTCVRSRSTDSSEKIEVHCVSAIANTDGVNEDEGERTKHLPIRKGYTKSEECENSVYNTRTLEVDSVRETTPGRLRKRETIDRKSQQRSKLISINLMDVYNENTDLQRVDKSEYLPKTRKRVKQTSPRVKIGKQAKRPKSTLVALPPKLLKSPRSARAKSSVSCRSAPELCRRSEIVDFYRSFQSQKDKYRHSKPDHVLWDTIDLSEESAVERFAEQQDNSDSDEGSLTSLRRPQNEPNTMKMWDMPLREAVKRVKSATNLPQPRDIDDATPRHIRVQKMYAQVKRMRRSSGYTVCKPLIYLAKRPNDFRV